MSTVWRSSDEPRAAADVGRRSPVLSLILCSRNDEYMGSSRWRLETSLNYVASHVAALGLGTSVEIVVTDWGSETPLRDVLLLDAAAAAITNFVWIPPDLARDLQGDSPFPEVLALNAAARRARGEYIGRIDQDTLTGGRFLSMFVDIAAGRLPLGIAPEQALFFARRRRIPYRFAVQCPPLRALTRLILEYGHRLHVESAPTWAPFYVSSVGIWMVHRDIWNECGGYDEEMIYMGAMEGNMIARLMTKYRMVDLGALIDHDFYHLEHYDPWVARHCYTFRKGNDDEYRMEARLRVFNPNGTAWGLADEDLVRQPAAEGSPAVATEPVPSGLLAWGFGPFVLATGCHVALENLAIAIWRIPGRLAAGARVWKHRAGVTLATVAGRPVWVWPRALRARWANRDQGLLVFPKNIHRVLSSVKPHGSPDTVNSTDAAVVLVVVPGARSARVLLQTDVLPSLLESGLRVVILSPKTQVEDLRRVYAGTRVRVEPARLDECERYHRFGLCGFCALVRSCTGNGHLDLSTLDNRLHATLEGLEARRPYQARLLALVVRLLRRSVWLRRVWLACEARFFVKHLHADIFTTHRPALVVMATPGYDSPLEAEVLREAQSRGIPTAIVVRGWDNPTAKGMMAAVPDHFLAWTEIMKRELVEHHDVPASSITVTGAPYLDFYSARTPVGARDAFLRGAGLDPSRKTIVFATKPPASYSWNLDVIAALAEAIRDGRFPTPSQLLVRLYPLDRTSSVEAEELTECRRLAASFRHVALSVPEARVNRSEPRESAAEFGSLRAMLTHADVVVNVFSTLAIEAAMHDLPIVTVGYNGRQGSPETAAPASGRSVDRHARETHNRRLVSYGGTVVVRSEEELIRAVGEYLGDRSRDTEGRRRIVAHEVGPNQGVAGRTVGRTLADLVIRDTGGAVPEALAS